MQLWENWRKFDVRFEKWFVETNVIVDQIIETLQA